MARRRRSGGSAWRTSRQRIRSAITTTGGRTSWHGSACRVAAHGEHRGRGYCLSSLRQGVARRGISLPGWRQHMMSIEAWSNACLHLTRAGGRAVSHGAVSSACHQYDGVFMHQPPGERHRMESIRAVNTACHHYDGGVNWGISPPLVGRLRIENTKSVGSVCYHHDNGSCFRGIAPPGGWRRIHH